MPAATWPTHDVCPAIAGGGSATSRTGVEDRTAWPLSGSIIVHVLLVAILIAIPQKRWAQSQPEKILVQILTPQQFQAATEPAVLQTKAETHNRSTPFRRRTVLPAARHHCLSRRNRKGQV